jgi:hypothetical protein
LQPPIDQEDLCGAVAGVQFDRNQRLIRRS